MSQLASLPQEVFDSWADVYDSQPNPLLSLEQRLLGPMLVDVRGLDILDAGCGTGRWLEQLAERSPRSLLGIDTSSAMLKVAASKLNNQCDLRLGSCTALPVPDASADMVLCSFVVSYLDDLDGFACEIDRVARPGATVVLSDMHPDTEAALNWVRWSPSKDSGTRIHGRGWPLQQITGAFEARGFKLVSLVEPMFGVEEQEIFEQCGRPDLYQAAADLPAIYVLQLRKPTSSPRERIAPKGITGSLRLHGARVARGPDAASLASVSVAGNSIHLIQSGSSTNNKAGLVSESALDLSGFFLLPGLINAHDHLEFGLFPNIGTGPYQNATEWARDIQENHAELIERHRKVPRSVRLWWGGIRNLLCGVTTVCHHNPLSPDLVHPGFPVRVVSDFGWAHSLSLEPQLASKFAKSPSGAPFILHAAEGVDRESLKEIFELDRIHALDERTVLVHGLACTPVAVALINQRLAAVILCPTSNKFLFHQFPSFSLIHSLNKVMLGSDSPLTAAGDLLDEIRFAHTQIGLHANSVYGMVTNQPADILRLRRGEGRLRPGSVADMLVVRDCGLSPAETLAQLTVDQIELVISAGRVQLAGPALFERLPAALTNGLQLFEVDGLQRWVRAPIEQLITDAQEILGSDLCVGGKRVRRATAA
jgi:ubiquinone/menaquinone biosynthesis C-methylase UbiE/cytosine/adenosine deaminase-related metal-dependent hydrolase